MLIVGDSHAAIFESTNYIKRVGPKMIGHRTAFKLADHDNEVRDALRGSYNRILFVFGEIDCRFHIAQKANEFGIHILKQIEATASKYVKYVARLRSDGYNIAILSITPQSRDPFGSKISYEERVMITQSMNCSYERYCKYLKIPFFNIYYDLITVDGFRKPELIKDRIHLGYDAGKIFLSKGYEW
jgi:hypothetical protein